MFGYQFYPTPKHILESLDLDIDGKIILEPSAGSGNIVEYCKEHGADRVLCYEIDDNLRAILKTKAHVLGKDFLQSKKEELSHVNLIISNPPFGKQDLHLEHMIEIAPEGCEIICLCNYIAATNNSKINKFINQFGNIENLGPVFKDADRTTDIDIGIIKLFKPILSTEFDYEGFYLNGDSNSYTKEGIISYNEIRAIVGTYVSSIRKFDIMNRSLNELNKEASFVGLSPLILQLSREEKIENKLDFSRTFQRNAWKHIFKLLNITKYVTEDVQEKLNRFIEQNSKYPFTERNIYKMIEIIYGTREENFNKALIKVVDKFTQHTHENRFSVEGWKTNLGHLLNHKIIINHIVEPSFYDNEKLSLVYSSFNNNKLNDLIKVLSSITGVTYQEGDDIHSFISSQNYLNRGEWYDWTFFSIKGFKKGTLHLKFKNLKHWESLNRKYGELKGMALPEKMN